LQGVRFKAFGNIPKVKIQISGILREIKTIKKMVRDITIAPYFFTSENLAKSETGLTIGYRYTLTSFYQH
jgi:hypothetical protein